MSFISGSSTIQLAVGVSGKGAESLTSPADVGINVLLTGDLLKVTRIKRAKPISPTRIRVDFTGLVDNNEALVDTNNWKIFTFSNAEFQAPTILSVEIPSALDAELKYVILITSEMNNGATYVICVNSQKLFSEPSLITDGDMEAADTSEWTSFGLPSPPGISKISNPNGGKMLSTDTNPGTAGIRPANSGLLVAGRTYVLTGTFFSPNLGVPNETVAVIISNEISDGAYWQAPSTSIPVAEYIPLGYPNRAIVFAPQVNGRIQFAYIDPTGGGNSCYWDDLSLQEIHGAIDSSAKLITSNGIPLAKDAIRFDGMGVSPKIKMAIGITPDSVVVFFTEAIATDTTTLLITKDSFSFNNGLQTYDIDEVGYDYVILRTSTQIENELYTLTIDNAIIQDLAGNKFATPTSVSVLGYAPGVATPAAQALRMYMFLLESIRIEDQERGNKFVERLFDGPQAIWEGTTRQILAIPDVWSLEETPDIVLPYLKDLLGWTKKLDGITNRLDSEKLRRLISISAVFWKQRGSDNAIEDLLRLITGAICHVLDWFWYRWILDETAMGEDHEGFDPWILSSPGEGPDTNIYNVRIVDNGNLDYELVRQILRLTRPTNERVDVSYINFADRFLTDGDKSQWLDVFGVSYVVGRHLIMNDGNTAETTKANVPGASDWSNYTATFRVRGGSVQYEMSVYYSDTDTGVNAYQLIVSTAGGGAQLRLLKAGSPTATLAWYDFSNPLNPGGAVTLSDKVHYTFRIVVTPAYPDSPVNDIKVYWEANLLFHEQNADLSSGTIAVGHKFSSVELSQVEMFFNPMKTDFVDINS